MILLSTEKLTKKIADRNLFRDLSFGIEEGEKVAFIGKNGSGKSTLLRILAGLEEPDSGSVVTNRDLSVCFLAQDPRYPPELTVGEAVRFEFRESPSSEREDLERRMISLITELGLMPEMKCGDLSGGMLKKVALAAVLSRESCLLMLDEPTNHLDIDTIEWLQKRLDRRKGGIILVTHDRYFLDSIVTRIYEIDSGSLQRFDGNYGHYLTEKGEMLEHERESARKERRFLVKELEWFRRQPKARGTKSKSRTDRIHEILNRKKTPVQSVFEFSVNGRRLGKKILEIKNVAKSYGGRAVITPFTHLFKGNERIGITGPNGSGKSTLLNIISGRIASDSGDVILGQNTVIGYFDQQNVEVDPEMKPIDYIKREAGAKIKTSDGSEITAGLMLEYFGFDGRMQNTPFARLSGGERRRLYLIRILMQNPNFLILDEPTNDLDIDTMNVLEGFLDTFPGCVLIVSHDRYFLDRTVDELFVFDGAGHIAEYPGGYSDFLEIRTELKKEIEREIREPKREKREKSKLSYNEKRELTSLTDEIDSLEKEREQLLPRLQTEKDYQKLAALGSRHVEIEQILKTKIARWEELAAIEANP
jgi:ATP-binding cassette subfamily F protein uup